MFVRTICTTNTRTIRRPPRATSWRAPPRSECTRRASMDKTCGRSTRRPSRWSSAPARARVQHSFSATPTAIWDITWAMSAATITAPSRKSSSGRPSAIRSSSWAIGCSHRIWRIVAASTRFTPRSNRIRKRPSSSPWRLPFRVSIRWSRTCMPETATAVRELTLGEAVREALAEELRRDPRVFLMGEDVAEAGTAFKVLSGLVQEFGRERVLDTPISEAGFTGIGVGAAMTGLRPVVDIMFGDFVGLIMDQMVNQAAKVHYMSGGRWNVPMVLRTTLGATRRSAAQHSQSLHAWFSHVPGLKVVLPSTPYDAKGLLKTAIRDPNPVVIFEDKMMYKLKGPVPTGEYTIPFGVADVKREGSDITIVATSSMVQVALGAASLLEDIGVSAEVLDPRTTWPLDERGLIESVKKTSRAIVVDEGYGRYGVTGEIASVIAEGAFYHLDAPVKRMGAMHVPIPFSPPLEDVTVPTEQTVFEAARALCKRS